jgi:hypothetical protein
MIRWSRFAVVAVSGVLLSGSMLAVPMARAVVAEPVAATAVVTAVAGDAAGRVSPAVWRRYDWRSYDWRPGVRQYPPYQGYAERFRFAPGWRAREWGRGSPREWTREWSGRAGSGLRFGGGWYGRPDRPYYDRRPPGWRPEWRPDWRSERRYVPNGTWRYGRQVGGSDWYVRPSAANEPAP